MSFSKLVRYHHPTGRPHYGDLLQTTKEGYVVQKIDGDIDHGFTSTNEEPTSVTSLLCPLESTPVVICIGVNYRGHASDLKTAIPHYPVLFNKFSDALNGPTSDVRVHPLAQSTIDFEGELTVVIGRDAYNVTENEALDYVLGYTIGNDVSARRYQAPDAEGGQAGYGKAFETFAPIGPAIVSPKLIPDPQKLRYTTKVNGEVRQDIQTSDMIWSVKQIIAFCSTGRTLKKGTVIMTGTAGGSAWFDGRYLKDGDVVEVDLEGYGGIANKMVFDDVKINWEPPAAA